MAEPLIEAIPIDAPTPKTVPATKVAGRTLRKKRCVRFIEIIGKENSKFIMKIGETAGK